MTTVEQMIKEILKEYVVEITGVKKDIFCLTLTTYGEFGIEQEEFEEK